MAGELKKSISRMDANMKLTRQYIGKPLLYLYIFYVVYTPIFGAGPLFDKYIMLCLLASVMLVPYFVKRDRSILNILSHRNVVLLMLTVFLLSLYPMILILLVNDIPTDSFADLRFIQNNLINILIIHAAIIIDKLKRFDYSKQQGFEILLRLGALQGSLCILGLLIPAFKEIFVGFYQAGGGMNPFVIDTRIFGISSDYTFGTPIYHGLIAGLAVYFALGDKISKYYLYVPLILLATLLNGRTGILVFIFVAVISIIHVYAKRARPVNALIALSVLCVLVVGLFASIQRFAPSAYNFVNSFVDDTRNLLVEGELTGNYEVLYETSQVVPEGAGLWFGEGYRIYDSKGAQLAGGRSDVGYINDLFVGGIFYILALYGAVFAFLLYRSDKRDVFMFLLIVAVLLFVNIKGEVFRSAIVMFLVVYIKLLFQSYGGKNEK